MSKLKHKLIHMGTIKTFEEFVNDNEYNLLLEEIDRGDFTRFNNLDEIKQGKIMKTWSEEQLIKYYMQNTISEEECFGPVLKIIKGEE